MFGSKDLLFTSEKYNVARSLRFRSSASAYLNRTPGSAGNRTTWTWSGWVKRGAISSGSYMDLFSALIDVNNFTEIRYHYNVNDDALTFTYVSGGVTTAIVSSTNVFRDPSAWYSVVVSIDTTQTTAANRVKFYVNNQQVSYTTTTYPAQNTNLQVNSTSAVHWHGGLSSVGRYFDGYMAEINFIDGQALTPSSFGFYDNNGIWQPKGYTGTYGTNGFYLKFTDNSGATATTIGKDSSGNSNNWTPNNISVTSGTTYDSMIDSPTNYADGGNGVGNYAVLNPLDQINGTNTYSNANLTVSTSASVISAAVGTIYASSGKWYWEFIPSSVTGVCQVGIAKSPIGVISTNGPGESANAYTYVSSSGNKANNNSFTAYGATYTTNDVIGVALDLDSGTLIFYKNNVSQGTAYSSLSGSFAAIVGDTGSASTIAGSINFGQRPFSYTPPSGYSALNTQNLTTPTIANGAQYMAAVLYTGTGSSQTITASNTNSGNNPLGMTFQPDLVWIKSRSNAQDHKLTDVVRGTTKALISNSTATETTDTNGLTAFTTSGFTIGSDATYNTNTYTYVGWQWKAGGTGVSNTSGSITSTVSANTTAGFSVLTYTGSGTASATIGHGLSVAPSMIIVKTRTNVADSWFVYHVSLGASNFLRMESTAAGSGTGQPWASTAPGSSVFTVGDNTGYANRSSTNFVAYCFAAVAGYSAFGSYTGNGSTDGPFVYLGFLPRYVMIKRSDGGAEQWNVIDTSRNPYNTTTYDVAPNSSGAETTSSALIDVTANGFKLRFAGTPLNTTSGTYIYAAFAENPFKYSRAR